MLHENLQNFFLVCHRLSLSKDLVSKIMCKGNVNYCFASCSWTLLFQMRFAFRKHVPSNPLEHHMERSSLAEKKKKKHKKNMYVTLNKHPLPLIVAVSLVNAEEGHSSTVQRIAEYCTRMSGHFPCFLSRQSS